MVSIRTGRMLAITGTVVVMVAGFDGLTYATTGRSMLLG